MKKASSTPSRVLAEVSRYGSPNLSAADADAESRLVKRESNNYEHSSRVEKCAHALRITEPTYVIRVRVAADSSRDF